MKKIFGGIDLTWKKIIILAIVIGVLIGGLNSIPQLKNTSLTDPAIYFDLWILFGIIIIMNAKSNKDSALKCFIFFLISQPLIYLVEVPFSHLGWQLFGYYKYWFIWTVFCLPMGYIGYYLKKNKWWGVFILLPIMGIIIISMKAYINGLIYDFPHHLLSYIFCIASLIIYPLFILGDKRAKIIGLIVGILGIIAISIPPFINRPTYETDIMCSGNTYTFDDSYKVSLKDSQYGEVSLKYIESIEDYCIHAKFTKTGNTELSLINSSGEEIKFDLEIGNNTYHFEEIK